ncbi:hypothetical protein BH10PAT2_BH10PAT2_1240 [soil metagenome]
MTYMFIFAHPDDETVACSATIKQLIDAGEKVILVTATDGSAGEVMEQAQKRLKEFGSVAALRRKELKEVAQLLNVTELHILDFKDGEINNKQVWTELKTAFIELMNQYKPDAVITFDHSGWYFHLDHVGVSIAATLAFQEAEHKADALLHTFIQIKSEDQKWKYIFPETLPITHLVSANHLREFKLKVLAAHASQNIEVISQKVHDEVDHQEIYQLVLSSEKGKQLFENHSLFKLTAKM